LWQLLHVVSTHTVSAKGSVVSRMYS